jgi:DUF1680 family protein
VVYCAESVDNVDNLHRVTISPDFHATEIADAATGLVRLEIPAKHALSPSEDALYSYNAPVYEAFTLKLIPYSAFANRGESNMMVWFRAE